MLQVTPPDAATAAGASPAAATDNFRLLWLAVLALPVLVLAGAALWAWTVVEREADAWLLRGADVLHEHALRALEAQEILLTAVEERVRGMEWPEIAASHEVHDFVRRLRERTPTVGGLLLVTPEGRIAVADWEFPARPLDLSDREYVRAHAAGEAGTYIGEVVATRPLNSMVFTVSRPRRRAGLSDGLVVASFDPAAFARFYGEALGELPGTAALVRTDGTLLARYPEAVLPYRLPPDHPTRRAMADGTSGPYHGLAALSQVRRRYVQRAVAGYPLHVVVAWNEAALWAAWARQVAPLGILTLATMGLLSLLAARAQKDARARAAAEAVASRALEQERGTRRLRTVFESIADGVGVLDRHWRITYVNDRMRALMELGPGPEPLGRVFWEAFPAVEHTAFAAAYRESMETGRTTRAEGRSNLVDLWIEVTAVPADEGLTLYVRDVSERHRAEAEREALLTALQAERAQMRAVFDTVPVGLVVAEAPSGRIVEGNRQAEHLFGHALRHSADVAAYAEWVSHHPDERRVRPEEYPLAQVITGAAARAELEVLYRRGDGRDAWLRLVAAAVRRGGVVTGGVVAVVDVDQERRSIASLEAARERQALLINELNHRVKNTLATVQSIAGQTLRDAAGLDAAQAALTARLRALAAAHDVLTRESWEGAGLEHVVAGAVAPFQSVAGDRLLPSGPALRVSPRMALALALALHELATNAAKYGALSVPGGLVAVGWAEQGGDLVLRWAERGGPPVRPPARRGFGTRLIERGLRHDLGGSVRLDWRPEGVVCEIVAPLGANPAWQVPPAA